MSTIDFNGSTLDDNSEYIYEIFSIETVDGDCGDESESYDCGTESRLVLNTDSANIIADDTPSGVDASGCDLNQNWFAQSTSPTSKSSSKLKISSYTNHKCNVPIHLDCDPISMDECDTSWKSTFNGKPSLGEKVDAKEEEEDNDKNDNPNSQQTEPFDLTVNIRLKRKVVEKTNVNLECKSTCINDETCLSSITSNMAAFIQKDHITGNGSRSRRVLFPLILIFSIIALVLLHNGSLRNRKTPTPTKFFISGNPFITEFEFGQLKNLWARLSENEVSFVMYYAPWDSDCIRVRNEIEVVSNHYGQQIFFAAINCWWPDGECRKYQNLRRYPQLVAHIRSESELVYNGPILASYIIPFLDNVMNPVIPISNEGELLDLRAKHDAVLLGYFNFMEGSQQSTYRSYLSTAIKALVNDPWRSVAYTVVTNSRIAQKLKIGPEKESSLHLFVGNSTEHLTAKFSKPAALLSWIYSRANAASTLKWLNPNGIKSTKLSDYIQKRPTLILFTPRSFILGISPYFDLLREIVLDYYNCDNSPIIRSLTHRNILRRRLMEDKLSELEERCHELLDDDEGSVSNGGSGGQVEEQRSRRFNDNEDTCCHTETVNWRSFGGARRGMTKKCLCTSCVHISLPKCPAKCNHFDCLSTASRFLDDFDPNIVNNSAVYCNQIRSVFEPKYTSYYKISTTCSGTMSPTNVNDDNSHWYDVDKYSSLYKDEKISRMVQEFEIQHCRRLKLGMNYTDLNFPDNLESRQSISWRANFTGLACRTNRTLKFLALDSSLYPAFAESLGIDVFNVPHSTVAMIIDPNNENVHVLNHEILYREVELPNYDSKSVVNVPVNSYSKRSLMEFIKGFTEGTLPRFLRSQIVSSSGLCDLKQMIINDRTNNENIICVPELNTITFTNYVLGKSFVGSDNQTLLQIGSRLLEKDILVMYYAPWCGFCTSIAHIYLDVARFFAFSDEIIFARINGDVNDLPWEYTVDRYPTIMLFPAKNRAHSLVYPPNNVITKSGLLQFILKHGQLSVRIQTMLTFCKRPCIERTLLSISGNHRSIWRANRHNLFAYMLNKYEIDVINGKLLSRGMKNELKDGNKLKNRLNNLIKYDQFLLSNIRRLRRYARRQSLLAHFLLEHISKLTEIMDEEATLNEKNSVLSDELYETLFSKWTTKKNSGLKNMNEKQSVRQSSKRSNPSNKPNLSKSSKPKRAHSRDEL
ncbi:hypothetical protein RDWZM_007624 [Blomia tropicalis]|uniref:Thioredoxin domain-containing protein n=1 Tax=Blomia tropicalis TaxID=40697 RepID=A0A9Q0M2X8_BLOTA|nr:hypothetical protein RDWZM_007624 [Blomia tropicalis]